MRLEADTIWYMSEKRESRPSSYCGNCGIEIEQQEAGRKPKRFCSADCRERYFSVHRDSGKHKAVCVACGEIFDTCGDPKRKYCCHEHFIAVQYGREIVPMFRDPWEDAALKEEAPEPVFEEACELLPCGTDEAVPIPTVRVARAGEKLNPKRVFLLTGPSKFQGKYDHFVSLIPPVAEKEIMQGDVFVFCNAQRTQLSVLQW